MAAVKSAVVLMTLAVTLSSGAVRRDLMHRCVSEPLLSTDTQTRHVIEGATSERLHADDIFQHEFSASERMLSCNMKMLLTKMMHKKHRMMQRLPLPWEAAGAPGERGLTDSSSADTYPSSIDGVALDLESGLLTVDSSFSGMLLGFRPHEMPLTVHTPAATLRLTVHFVLDHSAGGSVHLRAQDVAVKLMLAERPELVTSGEWDRQWLTHKMMRLVNFLIEGKFSQMMSRMDEDPADRLANCMRDKINMAAGMFDIGLMQPKLLKKAFKMTNAAEKASDAAQLVKEAVSA